MRKKKIKNLKRKVFGISTFIFLFYLALLMVNPTIWTALIPIIIPSGSLAIGIITYDIIKSINSKKDKKQKTDEYIKNFISNNTERKTNDDFTNRYKDSLDYIQEDNYEIELDKPKIKTKGTI